MTDVLRTGRHERRGKHERDLREAEAWLQAHPIHSEPLTFAEKLLRHLEQTDHVLGQIYPGPRVG